jgi:hypothetical protein
MKNIKEKLWGSKADIIQNVIIGVLFLIIFLSNFSLVAQFLGKLNPLASYQNQIEHAEQRNVILEFDRVRLEDVGNILLAIQDFYFQKNTFPESLESLKKDGYLEPSSRLIDPGTNQPYFYQKREQDFVLCIWLSDMLKGVNTTSCPSSNSKESSVTEQKDQKETVAPIESKTAELEIVGDASFVNVRAEPNTSSATIAKVNLGDTFTFEDTKDNWYKISVTAEKIGWVNGDYVKILKSP